jgi:hypothetical protein
MALKGNLTDFPIIQIMNLINLARKSGSLVIQHEGKHSVLSFKTGKLVYAQFNGEDNGLINVLLLAKKISRKQAELMKVRASNLTDKQLGLMLVNAGYLSQADVIDCLQIYYSGVVKRFFTKVDGQFEFRAEMHPPQQKILVRVGLENLIIEGTRQMQEWEVLQEEIPSLEMAVQFKKREGAVNIRNLHLSVQEWQVVKYITPKNTIKQIAKVNKMNDLEIRRVIYTLLQAGVVEMIRPEGKNDLSEGVKKALPNQSQTQQRSVINRIIDRLRTA